MFQHVVLYTLLVKFGNKNARMMIESMCAIICVSFKSRGYINKGEKRRERERERERGNKSFNVLLTT